MTGSEVLEWFQNYYFDLVHWQQAGIVWLLIRTAIIFFVGMFIWKAFVRPILQGLFNLWHYHLRYLFFWLNPLRIPRAFIQRRLRKRQEEEAIRFEQKRQAEQEEKERREREERERAYLLIQETLSIQKKE